MQWLLNNVGVLIGLIIAALGALVTSVTTRVLHSARLDAIETGLVRRDAEQKIRDEEFKELQIAMHLHQSSTKLHIDPDRDKQIWDTFGTEMRANIKRLEEKIDRVLMNLPPPPQVHGG